MQRFSNLTQDPTIRLGMAFGGILGAVHVIFNIMNNLMNLQGAPYTLLNDSLLFALTILLFLAGYFTNQTRQGMLAGFVAGLVSALIGILSLWIITFFFIDIISRNTYMMMDFINSGVPTMKQFIIDDALSASAFEFFGSLILGALLGTLGGRIGSGQVAEQVHI